MRPPPQPDHRTPRRRSRPAAVVRAQSVSDAEYRRRYEREIRHYVARFAPADAMGPGEAYLASGRWAWIESGAADVARWCRYARQHPGLKVMNPDGSWRGWDPLSIR